MTTLASLLILQGAMAIQVYDCDEQDTPFQVVSMIEPDACPDPETDYKVAQILQVKGNVQVVAQQCLVKRTVSITRCGFYSILYGTHIVEWQNTLAISDQACRTVVRTREIKLGRKGEEKMFRVKASGQLLTTVFTKGSLDRDGNCQHTNFVSGDRYYTKSYEQTTYDITIKPLRAHHNGVLDKIVLE